MANWKKVLVSGSDAALAQLNVDNAVTASYFKGDGSALTGVAATSLDIDNFGSDLTSTTLIGSDKIIVSDNGTEGRTTISKLASPLQGNAITESAGTLNLNVDSNSFEISSNALAIKAGGVGGTDFADNVVSESAQIAADISGSLGANATLIRSLTAAGISGSLGANATLIRSLTAASISGSFNSVSASIASDIAGLDGDFATDAELNAATASLSSSLATDIATNLSSITTLEGKTLFSQSAQIAGGGDISGNVNNITVTAVQNVSLTSNEVTQIANIGDSTTISATQWGYVGNFDQNLSTANNVTFTDLSLDGDLAINTDKFTVANSTGNTSIAGTLNVTGNVTAAANLTVTGDLTVSGTTTTVNTSNLEVEDRFIFLNEGSGSATPAGEGGIIVEGSTAGQGEAFYYDGNSTRWAVASGVSKTATSATPDAFAAIAHIGTPAEATTDGYNQTGNLTVTLGGDIYIYA